MLFWSSCTSIRSYAEFPEVDFRPELISTKKLNEFALQSLKSRLLNYVKMHGGIGSQQEVAHILGVARPSLARAISELSNEGCIQIEGKEMFIDEENSKKYF